MDYLMEDPSMIFEIVLGMFLLIEGVIQMFTGKTVSYAGYAKKYTPESLERFLRPAGAVSAGEGIFIILMGIAYGPATSISNVLKVVSIAGMVVCVVIYLAVCKKYLVKIEKK